MHFVDGQDHGVNLGDVFTNIYGMAGTTLIVGNRSRDFENPQNDSASLKSPRDYEGDTSGGSYNSRSGSSSSLSSRSARNSASAGYSYKYIHEFQDRLELNTKEIAINAETLELHADRLIETANNFTRLSHKADTLESKVGIIEGTGVIQNSEHITSIAGKFQLNQQTNQVELINGTEFVVHERNGTTITVGDRLTNLTSETNSLGQRIATFEGSALWTQRNNITGVVGEFDVVTAPDGTKTLRVKSGGGMNILRNGVEYGVYDNGTLTGGVIVDTINGQATATIKAHTIDIQGIVNELISYDVAAESLSAHQITSDGECTFDTIAVDSLQVNGYTNVLVDASVTGHTLTLTYDDGSTVDFSAATTLSGAWSGSTLTVTANPQTQQKYSVGFGGSYGAHNSELEIVTNGAATKDSIVASAVSVPIKVGELNNGAASTLRYSKNLTVSVSSLLETNTVTTNGAVTPSSGKIGLSKVTVNVNNSTEIGRFTANGTYTPSSGKIGFNSVVVNVPSKTSGDILISAPPTSSYSSPSGATSLSSWRSVLADAVNNRKVLIFEVWLNGVSGKKKYYVDCG